MKRLATFILILSSILTSCSSYNSHVKISHNTTPHLTDTVKYDSTYLHTGWYYLADIDNGFGRELDKSTDTFHIAPKPIVTAKNFTTLEIYASNLDLTGEKYIGLRMQLDNEGTENWSIATKKAIGRHLAFILNNQLLYVTKVSTQITFGVTALNRGGSVYSKEELEKFKDIIESQK